MNDRPQRVGSLPTADDTAPDLAPFSQEETRGSSVADDLNAALDAALDADIVKEPVTLPVPLRPGMSVRFSTDIDDEKMNGWSKRSEDRNKPGGQDNLRFCCLVIATQCEAFLIRGQEPHDEGYNPFTFGHKQIRARYGVERAADAVRKVYGSDPHIMLVANEILDKAGFGDRVVAVDSGEAES